MRSSVTVAVMLILTALPAAFGQAGEQPDPGRAFKLIKQAEERIGAEDFSGALEILARARTAAPTVARIPFMMATCHYNLGLRSGAPQPPDLAWKLLDQAIELDLDWGEPHFFAGVMSFNGGNYEAAVMGFQNALARAYRPKDSRMNLALSLFKWGVVLSGENRPEEDLQKGIRVFTDSVDRFAALKDDLRFSVEDRKSFARHWIDSLVNLVAMLQRNEDYADAERVLNGLIRIQPGNYLHHYNLGLVLGGTMKNWDRALEEYRLSLELCDDPDWLEPYPMIGYILSNRARSPEEEHEAESYFLKYVAKHPNSVSAYTRAGDHYKNTAFRQSVENAEVRNELLEKAVRSYERCMEIDPRNTPVMLKLSEVLRVAKRKEEAKRWKSLYDALKKKNPGPRPGDAPRPR